MDRETPATRGTTRYDDSHGEADFLEGRTGHSAGPIAALGAVAAAALLCGLIIAAGAVISGRLSEAAPPQASPASSATADPNGTPLPILLATNTGRPPGLLPTVTLAPPTAAPSPTEGPCQVVVQPGDDMITLAYSCGHRSLDVLPLILEMNGLDSPEALQSGQTLLIPRPTPELGATATAGPTDSASTGSSGQTQLAGLVADASSATPTPFPSATLLPGVTWHTVASGESLIEIMYAYNTSAEVLSQLNPEVPFSQCDFQFDTGGPRCLVILQPGQLFRVPAPTPTITLSPTRSGSETPTPRPTPTVNMPSALSPSDRALFRASELVTLRWVTPGSLGPNERYLVEVTDVTSGQQYQQETQDLAFIIPPDWQGSDARRHDYQWTVSVIEAGMPEQRRFTTETRSFSWEGSGSGS